LWSEYQENPSKFFGRKKVINNLKAEGVLPYTPAERLENAYTEVQTAYLLSHGESPGAKVVQFSAQFIEGLITPPGTPDIYGTFAGKMGSLVSSIVGRLLPF